MTRLLVATTNRGKLLEIGPLLADLPFELVTLADYPSVPAPDEPGPTFEANARAKAMYYANVSGALTVAEDSGLEIDALGGAPGVESARFGGVDTSYAEKFKLIYERLARTGQAESVARFVCALALYGEGRLAFETRGVIEGRIAEPPQGDGGFGYDPIFYYPPFGQTLAQAGERKSLVSHRGNAFRSLREFLVRLKPDTTGSFHRSTGPGSENGDPEPGT
jgi:XTP/dITP diphosphohydrolase